MQVGQSGHYMNETIKWIIEDSGEMWAAARDRTTSPVLVQVSDGTRGNVFELSLPPGEGHPFWRVSERPLTEDEREKFRAFRARKVYGIGDLMRVSDGYFRVRAFVYNARQQDAWNIGCDRVTVEITEAHSLLPKGHEA